MSKYPLRKAAPCLGIEPIEPGEKLTMPQIEDFLDRAVDAMRGLAEVADISERLEEAMWMLANRRRLAYQVMMEAEGRDRKPGILPERHKLN